jgi:predicted phosphodiesterase
MRILILSDTHYGFSEGTHKILETKLKKVPKDIDLVIHAGDWISDSQAQWKDCFELFRSLFPTVNIIGVLGNHDLWNNPKKDVLETEREIKLLFKKYNIHYLPNNPFISKDIIIYGFNGWYYDIEPPSNDRNWINNWVENKYDFNAFLSKRSCYDMENILNQNISNKYSICVTHFGPNDYSKMGADPKYIEHLSQKFNLVIIGHSHIEQDYMINNCRVINPGSDYNDPKFKIIKM